MEAIADLLSIARLPPGHDPGTGYGVATAARQRWPNDTCARMSGSACAAGARPGGSRRSRRSRPSTAVRACQGRPRRPRPVTAVTAGHDRTFRTRGRERSTRERYCCTTHTGERTSERTDRTAGTAGDTAPPAPGRIAVRARSRRTWQALPVTAVTASQGRTFQRGVTTPTSR